MGIAVVPRLYLVLTAKGIDPDGTVYLSAANDFLKGDFLKAFSNVFPPFYPFLTALLSPLAGDVELAGRIVSLIFGTLTLLPVYYLGRRLFGEKITIFSIFLLIFHPYLAEFSGSVLSESVYTFLVALGVLVGWKGLDSKSWSLMFLLGILLGLAYLTRPEGLGFVALFLLWIFFSEGLRFWQGFRIKWFMALSLVVGISIFAIPYILFLHQVTGKWILSQKIGL